MKKKYIKPSFSQIEMTGMDSICIASIQNSDGTFLEIIPDEEEETDEEPVWID